MQDSATSESLLVPIEPTSIGSKLLNVFAAPSEVFDEIAEKPVRAIHWLLPVVICIAIAITSILVIFSQPSFVQQIRDAQNREIEKKVQAGKMTQSQANQ